MPEVWIHSFSQGILCLDSMQLSFFFVALRALFIKLATLNFRKESIENKLLNPYRKNIHTFVLHF